MGAVKVSLYEGYSYTGNLDTMRGLTPSRVGRYDNFESFNFKHTLNDFGMILQTYFVPPSDGLYKFILVSDDAAKLYISSNDEESAKYEIIHNPIAIGITDYRLEFFRILECFSCGLFREKGRMGLRS